jgi:hypothetical protein
MNVRLKYATTFTAGVFYADQLRMNNYQVKLKLITDSESGDDHNIALERIRYFIQNQLTSTIFINSQHVEQCKALANAGLKITTLPEEPIDQVIGIMLYSKLNAIVEDRMIVFEVETSSDLGDNIIYLHDEEEAQGPFADYGWWKESDAVHCDLSLFDSNKVIALNHLGAVWKDVGLNWSQTDIPTVDDNNIVVFADFTKDETK